MTAMNISPSVVYFIGHGGHIKVGTTSSFKERMATFRTVLGEIEIIGTIAGGRNREGSLHKIFVKYALGGEWFEDRKEVRAVIADLLERFAVTPAEKAKCSVSDSPHKPFVRDGQLLALDVHLDARAMVYKSTRTYFDRMNVEIERLPPEVKTLADEERQNIVKEYNNSIASTIHEKDDGKMMEAFESFNKRMNRARTLICNLVICNPIPIG